MNATLDKRVSSNMRRLQKGDKFIENFQGAEAIFEVTGYPEIIDEETVRIPLRPFPNGRRSRRYDYDASHRVKLVK